MASYVKNSLSPNEEIIKLSGIHWIIYVFPVCWILAATFIFASGISPGLGILLNLSGYLLLLWAWITVISTEFAVTSKRVISKTGLVFRHTNELNLSRVESLHINQSIFGRIFNYGTVTVQGTGGNQSPLRYLKAPLELRRALNDQIEALG